MSFSFDRFECACVYLFYSARSYSFAEYLERLKAHFDGLHAAGYNSAESEPILVKFGTL